MNYTQSQIAMIDLGHVGRPLALEASRRINDNMVGYVARNVNCLMIKNGIDDLRSRPRVQSINFTVKCGLGNAELPAHVAEHRPDIDLLDRLDNLFRANLLFRKWTPTSRESDPDASDCQNASPSGWDFKDSGPSCIC